MSEDLKFANENEAMQHLADVTGKQIIIASKRTATSSKYPELDTIAKKIADDTARTINKAVKEVESEMPYKTQYVLEEAIKILEGMV